MNAFGMLAIFCNVPFKKEIDEESLRLAFSSGVMPEAVKPYLDRAVNEMPIEMLGQIVNSFDQASHATIIRNIQTIAQYFGASKSTA